MRRSLKIFLWSSAGIVVLALFFIFALPAMLRAVLEQQIANSLHRPAAVASVTFNPFTLRLTVEGLAVSEPDGSAEFFAFEKLALNAQLSSLFKRGLVLNEVTIHKPRIHIVHTEANRYNFSDILASPDNATDTPDQQAARNPFLFSIANIQLIDGSVEFDDRPAQVVHKVTGIEIGLPLISNFKQHVNVFVQPSFSATVNGREFHVSGLTKPFAESQETKLDLDITGLELARYLAYVPVQLNFTMPSGSVSTRLQLSYMSGGGSIGRIRLQGKLGIADLVINSLEGKPMLALPELAVSGIDCDVSRRELIIGDISVSGLSLALGREQDGTLSLQKLIAGKTGDTQANEARALEKDTAAESVPAWSVTVRRFTSQAGALTFDDLVPEKPARISINALDVSAANISTVAGTAADIKLSCRINAETPLALTGTFMVSPPAANLKVDLDGLDIVFAQSYIPETLLVDIKRGTLTVKGAVDFKMPDNTEPAVEWRGDVRLANAAASRRGLRDTLLKFSSLGLNSMRAGNAPPVLDIKTLKIADLYLLAAVQENGSLNLASLGSAPENQNADAPPQKQGPAARVDIGRLVLEKGRVQFVDASIKPRYTAELADISGSITGISSRPDSQADVRLTARLLPSAPLSVNGTLKPLQDKLSAKLMVTFKDIGLSQFTPYSGKFIGRTVNKGKLSLNLEYDIDNNRLTSHNRAFIDQLTLGARVKSPDATSLPVGLAISLLKDRKGEIHLDLPVSGDLDDPEFRVGKVIFQTLVNLLEKAATSPFSLVGAMLPDGVDPSGLTFPCGTAQLTDEALKTLSAIAGLMNEKPGLRLEIQARGSLKADMDGLRREGMLQRIRQQKYDDLGRREREGLTPETVHVGDDEFEEYLWKAYRDEDFDKPEGLLGITKRLPAEEMQRLMIEHMPVNAGDVRELVQQRARAVEQYLSEEGGVAAGRLFIVNALLDQGAGAPGCAVEFALR